MGLFPTPYIVYTRRFHEGPEKDPRGSLIKTWDAPVPQAVIAIGPKELVSDLTAKPGYDRRIVRRDLLVPPEFEAAPQDKVIIPAHRNEPELEYLVADYPADYCVGPWGFQPGLVVSVTRTEG